MAPDRTFNQAGQNPGFFSFFSGTFSRLRSTLRASFFVPGSPSPDVENAPDLSAFISGMTWLKRSPEGWRGA